MPNQSSMLIRDTKDEERVMSQQGQNRKSSLRAYVFRFTPESRHSAYALRMSVLCQVRSFTASLLSVIFPDVEAGDLAIS
jgi:hypothetical protein